jgi:hypothetical protein
MSERITEDKAADALEHLRACEYEYPRTEQALRAIGEALDDWSRLRKLIARVLPPEGAPTYPAPRLLGAAELRGQIVRDLVAEAKSMRKG